MTKLSTTNYADYLKKTSDDLVQKSYPVFENEVIEVGAAHLKPAMKILKEELGFTTLLDIICVDWSASKTQKTNSRFELSYLLFNTEKNERVQVKVFLNDEKPEVVSLCDVFGSANWAERECFDMMGIIFTGHPNLKRLLMWDEFEGHPLRKDYALDKRQPIPVLAKLL
jgi:NADH/F420H2 dehydrogenase subunit C